MDVPTILWTVYANNKFTRLLPPGSRTVVHTNVFYCSGLVTGSSYIFASPRLAFALERPYHLFATTLIICALLLNVRVPLPKRIRKSVSLPPPATADETLALHDVPPKDQEIQKENRNGESKRRNRSRSSSFLQDHVINPRRLPITVSVLILALTLRLEFAWQIANNTNCASKIFNNLELLALLLYSNDKIDAGKSTENSTTPQPSRWARFLESLSSAKIQYFFQKWSATILLMTGFAIVNEFVSKQRSNYICPQAFPSYAIIIPAIQAASIMLDLAIIASAFRVLSRRRIEGIPRAEKSIHILSYVCVAVLLLFLLIGGIIGGTVLAIRDHHELVPALTDFFNPNTILVAGAFAMALNCAIYIACYYNLAMVFYSLAYIYTNIITLRSALMYRLPYPQTSSAIALVALALISVASVLYLKSASIWHASIIGSSNNSLSRLPKRIILPIFFVFVFQSLAWLSRPGIDNSYHPIDRLMKNAGQRHRDWVIQASASDSLPQATKEYQARYKRDPPPRFQRWVNYAQLQGTMIMDDYDSIERDLLPFWSMEPAEIRRRSLELVSNPYNWIGGIIVSNGKMTLSRHVPDTHKWMLEGVSEIMRPFVKWLPDMIIPINMNDECRVAVPFEQIENMRERGREALIQAKPEALDFPRESLWGTVPDEPITSTRLRDTSLKNSWDQYGSTGCSPSSAAKNNRFHNLRENCFECAAPHSLQQFVSNWTLAADPCHQPDMQFLHGIYLSPATFVNTNELMPIFSQSKAPGFNDILYPSAWNYLDKTLYGPNEEFPDVDFDEKEPAVYWRGASSEGRSVGQGAWEGMVRQRLVHMVNNSTSSDTSMVLLPSSLDEKASYSYRSYSPAELHAHSPARVDALFVDHIERCDELDCTAQVAEFRPEDVPGVDFQFMWRHRYLVDLDGAGFSGRFLPFLHSKSLPFKTSQLREWWDDRVFPWVHFVPMDVRLQEFWSLVAYFCGWRQNYVPEGRKETLWLSMPHTDEAEKIASAGREWAQKVLRKEDMEVYMFRLLLEWARVASDERDVLGWRG